MPPLRTVLALAPVCVVAACGGDDEVLTDAGAAIDAALADGAPPDREDLCPGAFTFEALVADLESDAPVAGVSLEEVGNETNATSSAPNGRAVLCVPAEGEVVTLASKADHLARLDAVDPASAGIAFAAAHPYPLHVITEAAADALFTELGLARDAGDAQLVVAVMSYPDGVPLEGATVAITDKTSDGAFARGAGGTFTAGAEVAAGGLVLFANTQLTGGGAPGEVSVTVTPPGGFAGACAGPAAAPLEAGTLTGVLFACQ